MPQLYFFAVRQLVIFYFSTSIFLSSTATYFIVFNNCSFSFMKMFFRINLMRISSSFSSFYTFFYFDPLEQFVLLDSEAVRVIILSLFTLICSFLFFVNTNTLTKYPEFVFSIIKGLNPTSAAHFGKIWINIFIIFIAILLFNLIGIMPHSFTFFSCITVTILFIFYIAIKNKFSSLAEFFFLFYFLLNFLIILIIFFAVASSCTVFFYKIGCYFVAVSWECLYFESIPVLEEKNSSFFLSFFLVKKISACRNKFTLGLNFIRKFFFYANSKKKVSFFKPFGENENNLLLLFLFVIFFFFLHCIVVFLGFAFFGFVAANSFDVYNVIFFLQFNISISFVLLLSIMVIFYISNNYWDPDQQKEFNMIFTVIFFFLYIILVVIFNTYYSGLYYWYVNTYYPNSPHAIAAREYADQFFEKFKSIKTEKSLPANNLTNTTTSGKTSVYETLGVKEPTKILNTDIKQQQQTPKLSNTAAAVESRGLLDDSALFKKIPHPKMHSTVIFTEPHSKKPVWTFSWYDNSTLGRGISFYYSDEPIDVAMKYGILLGCVVGFGLIVYFAPDESGAGGPGGGPRRFIDVNNRHR